MLPSECWATRFVSWGANVMYWVRKMFVGPSVRSSWRNQGFLVSKFHVRFLSPLCIKDTSKNSMGKRNEMLMLVRKSVYACQSDNKISTDTSEDESDWLKTASWTKSVSLFEKQQQTPNGMRFASIEWSQRLPIAHRSIIGLVYFYNQTSISERFWVTTTPILMWIMVIWKSVLNTERTLP